MVSIVVMILLRAIEPQTRLDGFDIVDLVVKLGGDCSIDSYFLCLLSSCDCSYDRDCDTLVAVERMMVLTLF